MFDATGSAGVCSGLLHAAAGRGIKGFVQGRVLVCAASAVDADTLYQTDLGSLGAPQLGALTSTTSMVLHYRSHCCTGFEAACSRHVGFAARANSMP